ncbi:methyltransferase domain-containing protein [Fundidesulfovibrio butyratiphilus]
MKLSQNMIKKLRCLLCNADICVNEEENTLFCTGCGKKWPVMQGIPIFIRDGESLFNTGQYAKGEDTTYKTPSNRLVSFMFKHLPSAEVNVAAKANFIKISKLLANGASVLVVGGGVDGKGFGVLRNRKDLDIVSSDVVFQEKTNMICDAHDLPFQSGSFDCIVFQAVLEHVLDPNQCLREACRVLKDDGIVYAETPFMQQVHMGAYDFQRFTNLGHRWLFRDFEELSSGTACGAGTALCWSLIYFLQSFTSKRKVKSLLHAAGRVLFFPIKYFDYITHGTKGTLDGASGFYFLGRRSKNTLSYHELINSYRGLT